MNLPSLKDPKTKKIVIVTGGAAAVFVLWRYKQATSAASATPTDTNLDDGSVTDVGGATTYADRTSTGTTTTTTDSKGNTSKTETLTDAGWTQSAAEYLRVAGWDQAAVVAALGKYLADQPLTDAEINIVRAALAIAGPSPTSHIIHHTVAPPTPAPKPTPKPGPATFGAPTGLAATQVTYNSAMIYWNAVSGAAGYQVKIVGPATTRPGGLEPVIHATSAHYEYWLKAGSTYQFSVRAVKTNGTYSPFSPAITVKTLAK